MYDETFGISKFFVSKDENIFATSMQIHEKIEQARISAGLSQDEMAEKLGIGRTTYQYWEKKTPAIDKILRVAKVLNLPDDYFFGDSDENIVTESETFINKRRQNKNEHKTFLVPLVTPKARAGYVKMYDQVDYLDKLEQYAIPPNVNPAGAIWRYFEVGGDSAEPTLKSGDLLLCSQVPTEDWNQIRNFYFYVLVTNNEIFVKRVYRESEFEWILLSDNQGQYPPIKFDVYTLKEMWVVRRHIKKEMPVNEEFDIEKIKKQFKI